jgi:hypothetical protein
VELSIAALPVNRLECCCRDCRKGLAWCTSKGGPPPPPVPDLVYFPNAIRVDKGVEHLGCYLIKKEYNTRRVVAKCCWTCLVGDHPSYRGLRLVSYYSPPALLSLQNGENCLPVQRRIFQDDMTPEELTALPPFSPPPVSSSKSVTKEELDELLSKNKLKFETIQTLIDSFGKVHVMDSDYDGPVTAWNKNFPSGPFHQGEIQGN